MGRNRLIDLERQGEGGSTILHRNLGLHAPADSIQKRLELQPQRLARLDRDLAE
jgi:hypothetical protein